MKKNKGITLIALVITIIVLLILAGVAIAMLSGENGILKKAAEAKTKTEEAQKEEETTLNDYEIDGYFIEKGSKYKCRYGYITGIEPGEKVIQLKNSLPSGYTIYDVNQTQEVKNMENEILKTGMVIMKNETEMAKVIIFGDVDCSGYVNETDWSRILNFIKGIKNSGTIIMDAGDVNHDGKIDQEDADIIDNYCIEEAEIDQNKYVVK